MYGLGAIVAGFKIYGICGNYCIAKGASGLYVVWEIDLKRNVLHTDKYFENRAEAEQEFANCIFPWFKTNVHKNMEER